MRTNSSAYEWLDDAQIASRAAIEIDAYIMGKEIPFDGKGINEFLGRLRDEYDLLLNHNYSLGWAFYFSNTINSLSRLSPENKKIEKMEEIPLEMKSLEKQIEGLENLSTSNLEYLRDFLCKLSKSFLEKSSDSPTKS